MTANALFHSCEARYIYRVSLSSLFIRAILAETERSIVRSPISTTRPPRMSGFTFGTTLSLWPWPTYWDLLTADSRRLRVRLSRGCEMLAAKSPYGCQNFKSNANHFILPPVPLREMSTYRSTRHSELDLSPVRAHERAKLLHDTLQYAQPVVRCQRLEEVLHDSLPILSAKMLLQLSDNLLLVRGGERWCAEDGGQLCIFLEDSGERFEGFSGRFESAGFGGCSILTKRKLLA